MTLRHAGLFLLLTGLLGACQTPPPTALSDNLDAALWMRKSAEYRASAYQAYAAAAAQLDKAVAAERRQRKHQPLAIVMDLDETVLDNGGFQASLTPVGPGTKTKSFDECAWDDWVSKKSAKAVPGAVDFINHALTQNVTVFFVTNRRCLSRPAKQADGVCVRHQPDPPNANGYCPQADETLDNLKSLGVNTEKTGLSNLLLQSQYETAQSTAPWTDDKAPRWAYITRSHKILMMVGDQLADFVQLTKPDNIRTRAALLEANKAKFGTSWIVLPNPAYGSWGYSNVLGMSKAEAVHAPE